ncbi:Gfo/Idh/MocA family protein [Vibrio ishigakensis]|uniref:Gfo/Idh/MocA family protein n=1 Tax=Vibrio ishigakensis TaxID=1481914 RepID=UPI0021C330DB|nr:Gfo/Idh/MocA family oxidoreductase [Vibrio ishigakensis]
MPYNSIAQTDIKQFDIEIPLYPQPKSQHKVALIGCGAIGRVQASAYKECGWKVVALCDIKLERAESFQKELFPDAYITANYSDVLSDPSVDIVDLALHVDIRPSVVKAALKAGKNVMSQKPFVEAISDGLELCELAKQGSNTLAVNQNGRFAPHFYALREVVDKGHIGEIVSADFNVYWPHDLIMKGHPLAEVEHLICYDFAIHWFDLVATLFAGKQARSVYAKATTTPQQVIHVPTLVSVNIDFGDAQVSINMRASSHHEDSGSYHVCGTQGVASLEGGSLGASDRPIKVVNHKGQANISVTPDWFPAAFKGTMGDLMSAIDHKRRPQGTPESCLEGLRLCFAAIESSRSGQPVDPRQVERI